MQHCHRKVCLLWGRLTGGLRLAAILGHRRLSGPTPDTGRLRHSLGLRGFTEGAPEVCLYGFGAAWGVAARSVHHPLALLLQGPEVTEGRDQVPAGGGRVHLAEV